MKSDILEDKVIIIAGGCGRIGRNFIEGVYEHGGTPIIADNNFDLANKIINNLKLKYNSDVGDVFKLEILDKHSLLDLIDYVHERNKRIDVFVNTVYPPWKEGDHSFEKMSLDLFNDGVAKHLGSYFLAAQQFVHYFKKQGSGNIINISSIQGFSNPKFDTYEGVEINGRQMSSPIEYSCIKSAINSLTTYLAKYLQNTGIRCNIISPGGIESGQPKRFLKLYKKYCSSKGMLDGEDIKGTFVFLASDLSRYINGQNIIVDDGWSL